MVTEARRHTIAEPTTHVLVGDAHALPFSDTSVDRARTDRVLQHVTDPHAVLAEMRRVLRPNGRAILAEPDWDALAIASADLSTSADYRDFIRDRVVRNSSIGRQLALTAFSSGLFVSRVATSTPVFTDFALADSILGLSRMSRARSKPAPWETRAGNGSVPSKMAPSLPRSSFSLSQ